MATLSPRTATIPYIIPFLTWGARFRLAQGNKELRQLLLSRNHELAAFAYIAQIHNTFVEKYEPMGYGANPYYYLDDKWKQKVDSNLLSISSWLATIIRAEKTSPVHGDVLPVVTEQWEAQQDERLQELVTKVKSLCPSLVHGCQDSQEDQYLADVSLFTYPEQKLNVDNLLKMDDTHYAELSSAAHAQGDCYWNEYMIINIPSPHLAAASRLVYVSSSSAPFFSIIRNCFLPSTSKYPRVTKQTFITRAVMRDLDLVETFIVHKKCPPYAFLRWLTALDHSPHEADLPEKEAEEWLADNMDLLELSPQEFWNWSPNHSLDDPQRMASSESNGEVDQRFKAAYKKHFRHAMSQMHDHLAQVFELFDMEHAARICSAYAEKGLVLAECDKSQDSTGAYLELTLNNNEYGSNPRTRLNDHNPQVCVLHIGPRNAFLYNYHERHC